MSRAAVPAAALALVIGCHAPDPKDTGDTSTDTADTGDTDTGDTDTGDTDTGDTDTGDTGNLPPCSAGSTLVTWTRDAGATLAPVAPGPDPNTYTWSLAIPADDPMTMLVENNGTVWRSTDAGCTFAAVGTFSETLWSLSAAPDGRAWGYVVNGPKVVFIDGETITESNGPGDSLLGLAIDPTDATHIRVGAGRGLYDRVGDGRWTLLGEPPTEESAYVWAFDPANIDHVVVGTTRDGVWTTRDGGGTWAHAGGFEDKINIFAATWSPVDPDVVWAEGVDMDESDAGAPSQGRHVWQSTDGGVSFTPVVDQGGDVVLTNGVPMTADPVDPGVVWFTFGSSFGGEGTWLYRYEAGTVTSEHTAAWHGFPSLAFSPADPGLLYLAVLLEQID